MSSDNLNIPGSGTKKPKNLHIAHRRSPSELTTLMVEQYNLQRQLEQVQAQQKQILQQQQLAQQQYAYPPPQQQIQQQSQQSQSSELMPPPGYRSHSRSSSTNAHRRTGSSSNNAAQGHNRRHSLGLNEAIKAAANQRQTNRTSLSPSTTTPSSSGGNDDIVSFKFPPPPSSDDSESPSSSHSRSRSLAYGQQSFKFPASNSSDNLLPPTPNFSIGQSPERGHQRRGSHYRSGSRNFDANGINSNWRAQQGASSAGNSSNTSSLEPPQASFVPGHKPRNSSYGGSVSSLSHFLPGSGGGNHGNTANNGRKSLFAPYLPQSSLPELISDGRLVTGTLRVNKKNRSDAYVSTDGLLDADIFICGSKDRNRALEGDLVAVELLVVDEVWDSKKEKEEKKRRKDNTLNSRPLNDDIHNDATSAPSNESGSTPGTSLEDENDSNEGSGLARRGSLKQRPTMKKNDDVEVEGQSLLLVEEEEINDDVKPLYAGHVVAVVDRIPGQLFAGTLGLLRPAQAAQAALDKKSGKESSVQTPKSPKIVWFKPTDKKVPLIAIPTEQAPRDFVENHEKYANRLFVASIKRWPITSLHPFGTLVSRLGKIEDPNTEIDSILRDNNFLCDEYPDDYSDPSSNVYDLPSTEAELSNPDRIEYLNDYIIAFTQNGTFVDHALHVKRLSNTRIELGFHVVDVSYYIKPGSTLDRKSKKRSSSVFLPQKIAHLFPEQVNEVLSFKENERNLALSVVFEIDTANFEVEDLYIHESIVVPKQLVSYDAFDSILEGTPIDSISSATCDYIKTFSLIAKEFRRQRLDNRELGITPNLTLLDQLDDEKVRLNLNIFKDSLAYDIIFEISHKVNNAIAAKVHAGLGEQALLRRHPLPTLQKMETFVRKATNLGFKIDTTTSSTLQKSILSIEDPVKRKCIETLLYKCMSRGKYYVAGKQDPDSYGHYYYNLPLYTHFTAPLRRYADLIVHRQLKAVLNKVEEEKDLDSLKATADYCNFKKDCAANAQAQAIHLLLSQTINEVSENAGQLLCMGTVLQVYESSFDVFIPELGVEKRVHGDQLPLVKAEFDKATRTLELTWEKGVDSATYIPADEQSSLSYRNSIKNKYRTSALQAAKLQNKTLLEKNNVTTDSIIEKLARLNLEPPSLSIPALKSSSGTSENEPTQGKESTRSMPSSPTQSEFPKNTRTNSSSLLQNDASADSFNGLAPYLQDTITRPGNVQVIKELNQVPVLIRAEIGMALPCLTVRVLNPFAEEQ
ncbi:Exosomal 3'-5' exoribonuclease complex, subunit Rrp44/Dis3 [Scheffersomyces stipitis CBS 6054]|uniref:Exosomal 3'-5' exoribonuclease complex, subunit Rrp44/Dis3 n=1 Tax=Scheffersomyces stipitis (strain ATCC 58785 / CBS 6054 / NBRC 10063 / NRRL Y-11545) TaxID=322104 RepID=A3LNR8_PICST|nr:Exosomal 3'-5' exoribonuclease complex, subunit Rrp44/Dis3 [Scheffersomyces stipitis CBS 6054]ABN64374.2 Exosomal 3'-5' exoribonuclease complex, subunit Rrp44/Dis3 [Scheffersomyces stipitis CBS 6054]